MGRTFESLGGISRAYSTGGAAELAQISQQEIIRSVDEGRLKGRRVPGSKFRRVDARELGRFLATQKIHVDVPTDVECLLLTGRDDTVGRLQELLAHTLDGVRVRVTSDVFDAGTLAQRHGTDIFYIDRGSVASMATLLKATEAAGVRAEIIDGPDGLARQFWKRFLMTADLLEPGEPVPSHLLRAPSANGDASTGPESARRPRASRDPRKGT